MRQRWSRSPALVTACLALQLLLAELSIAADPVKPVSISPIRSERGWHLVDTPNFTICTAKGVDIRIYAEKCEQLRTDLAGLWLEKTPNVWTPRCYVVVHANESTYLQEVGSGGRNTRGCSTIKVAAGKVATRRIDLRGDRPDPLTAALPHEMAHIVLADRFSSPRLPRWADEGIAMLSDPSTKQAGHLDDFRAALDRGTALRLAELLARDDYPPGAERQVFYGQSAALVRYFIAQGSAGKFAEFLETANKSGYDHALRKSYGISDVVTLERGCLAHYTAASSTGGGSNGLAANSAKKKPLSRAAESKSP